LRSNFCMRSRVLIWKIPMIPEMSTWSVTRTIFTTWKPSAQACRAQVGSRSEIRTRAPSRARRMGALVDVAVAAGQRALAAKLRVGGAPDAVRWRVTAAAYVV
jgi:hypothetical protein